MRRYNILEKTFFILNSLHEKYEKENLIAADPVLFPKRILSFHPGTSPEKVEIAALISSFFAFGNRKSIISFLGRLFEKIPPDTAVHLVNNASPEQVFGKISELLNGLKYRWINDKLIITFFVSLISFYKESGSFEKYLKKDAGNKSGSFNSTQTPHEKNGVSQNKTFIGLLENIMKHFQNKMVKFHTDFYGFPDKKTITKIKSFLPAPGSSSASKRLMLFCKWCSRKSTTDLGIWDEKWERNLIYPLDTHILNKTSYFILRCLGRKITVPIDRFNKVMDSILEKDSIFRLKTSVESNQLKNINKEWENFLNIYGEKLTQKTGHKEFLKNNLPDAILITDFYRIFSPDDPLKYDFSLMFDPGVKDLKDLDNLFL